MANFAVTFYNVMGNYSYVKVVLIARIYKEFVGGFPKILMNLITQLVLYNLF